MCCVVLRVWIIGGSLVNQPSLFIHQCIMNEHQQHPLDSALPFVFFPRGKFAADVVHGQTFALKGAGNQLMRVQKACSEVFMDEVFWLRVQVESHFDIPTFVQFPSDRKALEPAGRPFPRIAKTTWRPWGPNFSSNSFHVDEYIYLFFFWGKLVANSQIAKTTNLQLHQPFLLDWWTFCQAREAETCQSSKKATATRSAKGKMPLLTVKSRKRQVRWSKKDRTFYVWLLLSRPFWHRIRPCRTSCNLHQCPACRLKFYMAGNLLKVGTFSCYYLFDRVWVGFCDVAGDDDGGLLLLLVGCRTACHTASIVWIQTWWSKNVFGTKKLPICQRDDVRKRRWWLRLTIPGRWAFLNRETWQVC